MKEEALLTGRLEPTNEWYAIAKIAGIKLCQAYRRQHGCDFIAAMPTNLYGPGDNFDPASSHVVPGLMAKIHRAKQEGRDSVEICRSVGSPACRMMADLFHMNIEEFDMPRAIREAGAEYIYNVHLADSTPACPAPRTPTSAPVSARSRRSATTASAAWSAASTATR